MLGKIMAHTPLNHAELKIPEAWILGTVVAALLLLSFESATAAITNAAYILVLVHGVIKLRHSTRSESVARTGEAVALDQASRATANLRLALDVTHSGSWEMSATHATLDERARILYGIPAGADMKLDDFWNLVHPDDRENVREAMKKVLAPGRVGHFTCEHRLAPPGDDAQWLLTSGYAYFNADKQMEFRGVVQNITDRKRVRGVWHLVNDELSHRVKNVVSIIQAISRQTFRRYDVPSAALTEFSGRLCALATAQAALAQGKWISSDLLTVVTGVLKPFRCPDDDRVSISGPSVSLDSEQTMAISLCLHELSTNAVKYGALANDTGTVSICWSVESGKRLHLEWQETGGPTVERPRGRGFGTSFIESMSQYMSMRTAIEFNPDGVACSIDLPLRMSDQQSLDSCQSTAEGHGQAKLFVAA